MRSVTRIGLVVVLAACVATAFAQLGGPPGGGPPPRSGGPDLIDDTRDRPPGPPRGEAGRYAIVTFSGGVMLLDSATGDTWTFMPDESAAKGHWESVSRRPHERRDRRPPGDGPPPERRRPPDDER